MTMTLTTAAAPEYLDLQGISVLTGLKPRTILTLTKNGAGPRCIKINARLFRWKTADVREWMEGRAG
jgi:predicted DNA-binding transcriptional regulator AlpA